MEQCGHFSYMGMGYKQQQRQYILNATMLSFSLLPVSFFISLLYMNIIMSPDISLQVQAEK